MEKKTISLLDKFLVNTIGIIPNKPEVREYLNKEAAKQADYTARSLLSKNIDSSSYVERDNDYGSILGI